MLLRVEIHTVKLTACRHFFMMLSLVIAEFVNAVTYVSVCSNIDYCVLQFNQHIGHTSSLLGAFQIDSNETLSLSVTSTVVYIMYECDHYLEPCD